MFGANPKLGSSLFGDNKTISDANKSKTSSSTLFGMPSPQELSSGTSSFGGFGAPAFSSAPVATPVFGSSAQAVKPSPMFGGPSVPASQSSSLFGISKLSPDANNTAKTQPVFGSSTNLFGTKSSSNTEPFGQGKITKILFIYHSLFSVAHEIFRHFYFIWS